MTIEGLDIDTIDALDFSHSVPCEAMDENGSQCTNAAEHLLEKLCCHTDFLLCGDCLIGWREYIKTHPHVIQCWECSYIFLPGEDPLKYVRRLT